MKFVAVTSCPTGIAHTYMAAEALEIAGKAAGHEVLVETQGSAGSVPLAPEDIASADGVIFAADLEVKDRARFAGKPTVEFGVKKAVSDAPGILAAAIDAVEHFVPTDSGTPQPAATPTAQQAQGAGTRIRQWLMTGVSYMIPFVAAGGILIALAFALGGYEVVWKPGTQDGITVTWFLDNMDLASRLGWGQALFLLGSTMFGFLVPALSGYIAYAIADRPGIAPGFLGGAISVALGAGFLGGIVTGFLAGFIALGISRIPVHKSLRSLMPVVVIPLLATLGTGLAMLLVLGKPIAWLMTSLTDWLNGLTGSNLIVLGIILGAMMAIDMGGPVNKVAYVFATTGLTAVALGETDPTQWKVMAAVIAAGMTPPLGLALATVVRRKLFTTAERENGKAAWALGAFFITEGAIPFAAADPLRVIPSAMIGSAVTGGLSMAFGCAVPAPHGGIVVAGLTSHWALWLLAIVIGTLVTAACVIAAKSLGRTRVEVADVAVGDTVAA